jgi:predicted unusual protein kinase regulating ubiquinone biosynthesis (AarF/ABC1/UbiB family)
MSEKRPLKSIASRWARRTLDTARAGATLGVAATRAVADKVLDREDSVDGEAFADRLDELKGLSMKVGQMLSYLDGATPPSVQTSLKRLQYRSRAMDWSVVDQIVREQYGKPPAELFDELDQEPFAAASIGQVHRGRIGERAVAVKVQYPEISKAIAVDLDNIGKFAGLASLGTAVASGPLIEELRARLREECDYLQEGAHQALFRRLYAEEAGVVVPEVFESMVRERVLVTGFVGAWSFDEFAEHGTPEAKSAAGLAIWRVVWKSIFQWGLFNGDPHPGNYRFRPSGEVALLDFGCVRTFDEAFLTRWRQFAHAVRNDDFESWKEAYQAFGFVGGKNYDFDSMWSFVRYLYEPMMAPQFRFTREHAARAIHLAKADKNLRKTAMPPEWLLLNRLQWGLFSLLARLDATGDFGAPFWAAIDGPIAVVPRPPRLPIIEPPR